MQKERWKMVGQNDFLGSAMGEGGEKVEKDGENHRKKGRRRSNKEEEETITGRRGGDDQKKKRGRSEYGGGIGKAEANGRSKRKCILGISWH